MALDIEKARSAGYSDAEIVDFLGRDSTLDIGKARKAGYKDSELIQHFTASPVVQETPKPATPVVPVPAPTDDKEMIPLLRQVADVPLKVGAGAVTGVRMIADAFGADSSVGKNLRGVEDYIAGLYSAQSKKDSQEIGRIMKEAEDKGVFDQVIAGAKAFSVAPVDMLANALGTSAPTIVAGLMATLAGAPALATLGVGAGVGALMGAGTVKGSIYDATKQALQENTNMSPKDIEARAVLAQEYGGKNLDQILMGTALGTIGASSGVEPALARQLAKGIATKEATKAAIKQAAAKDTALAAERGVIKQGAITGGKEFITETAQGGQEQLAQNIALQREGFDVPTMRGVVGQGTLEGLAGLGMGVATGGREAAKARRELAEDATKGSNIPGDFTTAKEEEQRAGVGFTKELADLLMPATDAAGKPLVSGVVAPEITEVTPPPKKTRAPKISAEGVTPESIQAANDYVGKIDSGETIKQSDYRKVARSIGLSIPIGKSNAAAVELIRNYLAEQGAPDATGLDIDTSGAGAEVAALAPATQTATGPSGPQPGGVVSTGTTAGPDLAGTSQQPATLETMKPGQQVTLYRGESAENTPNGQWWTTDKTKAEKYGKVTSVTLPSELVGQYAAMGANSPNEFVFTNKKPGELAKGQAPAAGTTVTPKKLTDLAPEGQTEVARRQALIAEIEMDGGDAAKEKFWLNKFLNALGVTGTLSARRETKSIEKDFLEEGELPYAVAGKEMSDSEQETERVLAYKESLADEKGKPKTIPDYDISEGDQQLYNKMRDEVNPQVKAANERRKELVTAYETAVAAYDQAEAGQEEDAAFKAVNAAEDALQEHGPTQRELPEYSKKFAADYKDVYFGNIKYGSKGEHRQAAKALRDYLQRTGGRSKEQLDAGQRRAVNHYEENRAEYSKMFKVEFPSWPKLTQEQKNIFLRGMPTLAGTQQDVNFAKLGVKLVQDSKQLSEGEKREKQNALVPMIYDEQGKVVGTVADVSRKTQDELEKLRRNYERNKPSYSSLSNKVVQMIVSGDLQGVLDFMSSAKLDSKSSPTKRIMKVVAQALAAMKLNTEIVIVESSQIDGDLAQYDPVKDVIYVTREGMSSNTILHEIIHAATVKVINEYLYGNKGSLSQMQLNAIKQLERIMQETYDSLADKHPEAYGKIKINGEEKLNLFEFVSYALTSELLQQDLHDESIRGAFAERVVRGAFGEADATAIGKNLPESKSQWSKFKLAIARILKVRDEYLIKGKLDRTADTNYMMEISAAFEDILVKPTKGVVSLPALPAKKAAAPVTPPKTAEEFRESGLYDKDPSYNMSERENPTKQSSAFYKMFTTREGWRNITRLVQDKSYASRSLFNKLDRADKINRDMSGVFNNFDEQGDLATGEARQFLTYYVQEPLDNVRTTFQEWIKLTNLKTDQALNQLHRIVEMFHEPERRMAKWVTSVPLSKIQNIIHNGKPISAAERRIDILGDQRTGAAGLIHKVDLTQQQRQALWQELSTLAKAPKDGGHADPLGDSPRISEKMRKRFEKPGSTHKGIDINMGAPIYNVLGIEQATVDKRMDEYKAKSPEERAAIEKILAASKVLSDATAKLNQIGNYWSSPVSNLVGMYDYQYYMPFKGLSKHSKSDELVDPESHGKEMQEQEHSADGRFKTSDNPILQLINDAYRSAGRAGRRNYTQAIKNSVKANKYNPDGTGVIPGEVVNKIKFEERNTTDMSKYKGGANIFHYNADGSIDIIRINDPKILNALRYTFRDASPMLDFANSITGFFGAMHTRYNYNFAPLNFVRDTLTNAWTIGASRQLGPTGAAKYLYSVGAQVVKNGLGKAMQVAFLEERGDAASKKMLLDAAQDPFVADMLEYLRFGGKTTYLQGFSLKSNLEQLSKNTIGRSRIVTNLEAAGKLIDTWNNMFEFTGRAAAYSIYKDTALAKNIKAGMSNAKGGQDQMSPAERAAAVEAAAFVKNLANFEKVGEKGRELGALYMFIRPSATGAVRAIEAVMPAFTSEAQERADMPPQIANDEAAAKKYMENFRRDRRNAQIMVGVLMGVGYSTYMLSMLGAPDDEWSRNNTKTDNMEQWTRFLRFHIPNEISQKIGLGKDVVFQIPWGFGLGSFGAIGAQIGGMVHGNSSIKEGLGNIAGTILPDSFLPLPMSKIPITDSPLNWLVDSIAPTVFRPVIEFISNKNGIGQAINSASQRRMGDAFTGSDRIPEVYKDVAKWWFRSTDGEGFAGVPGDVSPNTIYFFANSYLDGVSKLGEIGYNWANLDKGEREFNPKNDVPLFGSFFGAKTNVDSREYGRAEEKIKEIDKRLNSMEKDDPVQHALYVAKYPLYPSIVDTYQSKQGELNELRRKATEIRNLKGLIPKDRDQILKIITLEQNMLKHQMVEQFKVLGVAP